MKKVQGVIFDVRCGVPYFLIFHRVLNWRGWEFLKETLEPGETLLECLKRGIKEETHVKKYKIVRKLNKKHSWMWNGERVEIAQAYLVRMPMKQKINLKQKVIEHDEYKWATKEEALKLLTHTNQRKILRSVRLFR